MLSLQRGQNLTFIVRSFVVCVDKVESMKGPEAKGLYSHVLEELGNGLPGGRDKVKGREIWRRADDRWSIRSNDAS